MRVIGNVQSVTQSVTNGVVASPSWANVETNVRSKELTPLRNNEVNESNQIVHVKRRSFLYRAEDRTFTTKMRYVVNSQNYYITDIRNYMGRPHLKVMDCELRDNE